LGKIDEIVARYNEDECEEAPAASLGDSSARPQTQSYGQIPGVHNVSTGRTQATNQTTSQRVTRS